MTDSHVSNSANPDVQVLLIDDSKSARRVTASHLTSAGYSVVTASDGFAALADVVEHRPDVIVADIVMPRLDGYQTCALIKHNPDFQSIPVVLVSSRDGLFDRARGRLVGANAHLAKPFTEAELVSTVQQCLADCAASAATEANSTRAKNAIATESGAEISADETQVVSPL